MKSSTHEHPVVIIGAGPAGLTAGYYLSKRGVPVVVLEASNIVGGIAQTASYKGYRFDIGGHRFFTKNPDVEALWHEILGPEFISVKRMSRIFYNDHFFDYPLKPLNAFFGLGVFETFRCIASYAWSRLRPIRPERSLEEWVTNRFGKRLFSIFFKTYTEKVWGMPTSEISADWAAQRIKGLSLRAAVLSAFRRPRANGTIKTLIDTFQYPRLGPGQMWEAAARHIEASGGKVILGAPVVKIRHSGGAITEIIVKTSDGERTFSPSHVISSMALRDLCTVLDPALPEPFGASARSLAYRDFLTVVLIVNRRDVFPDNWIYIHDPSVKVGRVQNFRNWSAAMIPNDTQTTIGLEYFCTIGDDLWNMSDKDLCALGAKEIAQLGLVRADEIVDATVVRCPKAYPVYDDAYAGHVENIRKGLQTLNNFDTVGRNGMHKYNNQDHSMYAALIAARRLLGETDQDPWKVNADAEYHEEIRETDTSGRAVPKKLVN